jgi:hypothetical protein
VADRSWGVDSTPGFHIRSSEDGATSRARHRAERAREREAALAERLANRSAERAAAAEAREADRVERRDAADRRAMIDPHAAPARPRGSGRKDVVREQRDTRGYTTIVDDERIRVLFKRGASVAGLAAAFGIDAEAVAAILANDA